MKKSDSIKELATALAMAQASMGFAKKDAANPFFKSKYADLAAVVEAIKKPLTEHGLSYSQGTDIDEHGGVIVETLLMHKSGEWIEGRLRMMPVKADPQGIGSCITYARRYGLQAIVGVPADDDDGNAASGNETNANGTKKGPGVHRAAGGAMERLTEERQNVLRNVALDVSLTFTDTGPEEAYDQYLTFKDTLDGADEQAAFRDLFDSKIRTAFTKIYNARKELALQQ